MQPDTGGGRRSSTRWLAYAEIGVDEVHLMPFGHDPVGFIRSLGEHVVPELTVSASAR